MLVKKLSKLGSTKALPFSKDVLSLIDATDDCHFQIEVKEGEHGKYLAITPLTAETLKTLKLEQAKSIGKRFEKTIKRLAK